MPLDKFNARLAEELPKINSAIDLSILPVPCQPAARHVIEAGGKRMRPFLTVLTGSLLGNQNPEIYLLSTSMEMLHAATLLHDDILDNADSRRGQPAAHLIFGVAQTILAGDALLAAGNAIVAAYGDPSLSAAYSLATMQTAAGEILEMNSLGSPEFNEAAYLEIARGKTAFLIAQSCALGAIFAKASPDQIAASHEFGLHLGIAFQIVDDVLDFSPFAQTGKPQGGDIAEAKMTMPLGLYRASLSSEERIAFDQAFSAKKFTEQQISAICQAIAPFAEQTLAFADGCLNCAAAALARLPDNSDRDILLEMTHFVRKRAK